MSGPDDPRMLLQTAQQERPPRSSPAQAETRRYFRTDPRSFGVVKDDPDSVAPARPDPADAMAQVDAIAPACPLDRTVMHGEGDRIALRERDHLGARLHARPLLDQHELAAFEIAA